MSTSGTLDDLLSQGFFRAGHTVRQTRYVYVDGQMYSTVWSRVPLQAYELSKSQRRLLRRVHARYDIKIELYRASREQDELYERYQTAHPLDVGETITDIFGHHTPSLDFRTHILRISLDGRLIAFSCFDLGDDSIASLFGCYEPRYASESLGFASMLMEMEYGHRTGRHYYYPGYCVPGLDAFAYKLRLPNLEALTYPLEEWQPMPKVLAQALPKAQLEAVYAHLSGLLTADGIEHSLRYMPLADSLPVNQGGPSPLPHSIMLSVSSGVPLGETFIAFDLQKRHYELWLAAPQVDLRTDPFLENLFGDYPLDADLRVFSWSLPVYTSPDVSVILKYLSPGKLLKRIIRLD